MGFKKLLCLLFFNILYSLSISEKDRSKEALYLSPLISSGQISKAQEASQVTLSSYPAIKSHSGFITVNPDHESNLFFWYFPAQLPWHPHPEEIPLVLWLSGGPGTSCFYTIFGELGPFLPNITDGVNGVDLNFTRNPYSWNLLHHMVFIDNPVGVGFSHTGSPEGYIHSPEEAANDIYSFLLQFFKLFPNLKQNPFYLAGLSYGGTYVINLAYHIHMESTNLTEKEGKINLLGVYMDSPWIEAWKQAQWGEVLYANGLITPKQREKYLEDEENLRKFIDEEKYSEAFELLAEAAKPKAFEFTGYDAMYDMTSPSVPDNMTNFVNSNETRKALHVGEEVTFIDWNINQLERMEQNMMKSQAGKLEVILKSGYRIMIIVGNQDVITGHIGIRKVFQGLSWEGKEDFLDGNRTIFGQERKDVWGYMTGDWDHRFFIMRNAGHGVFRKQPMKAFTLAWMFFWGFKTNQVDPHRVSLGSKHEELYFYM